MSDQGVAERQKEPAMQLNNAIVSMTAFQTDDLLIQIGDNICLHRLQSDCRF